MFGIRLRILLGAMAVLMAACVTVNIYFPAAEVRQAAEDIAKDVRGPAPAQKPTDNPAGPQSLLSPVGVAFAQGELTVSNANIRQLKAAMKARYPQLAPYLQNGALGEAANGMLALRDAGALDLRGRAEAQRLMAAENADRHALYQAVAQALNVAGSDMGKVGQIFAQEWQRTAPAGTWIESAPGRWARK